MNKGYKNKLSLLIKLLFPNKKCLFSIVQIIGFKRQWNPLFFLLFLALFLQKTVDSTVKSSR